MAIGRKDAIRLPLGTAVAGVLAMGMLGLTSVAQAEFPEHTINYIIPFAPGGESDISARLQESFFQKYAGESVAIQYKTGAGGAAGWSQLNRIAGDGYTIMGTNLPHIILQPMDKDVGYKTEDIQNIYWFHYTPDALLVPAQSDFQTLDDFIQGARDKPGAVIVGGTGTKTGNELAKARFNAMAGINTAYIPFKGTGAVNTALLGNQINASWGYTTVALQLGDQVRCLAVAMEERHPAVDCPTFKELGYDLIGGVYRGLAVPKSTPADKQAALAKILSDINHDPEFIQKMEENGFTMVDVGPAEMDAFMTQMRKDLESAADDLGIKRK